MGNREEEFEELAAELLELVESEFRAEAVEVETAAAKQALRRRSLKDVMREFMSRGDTVTVGNAGRSFTGEVTHARGNLAVIEAGERVVSVNLGADLWVKLAARSRSGGREQANGSGSFKARLSEFEHTGEALELVISGISVFGRIAVVGSDHVAVVGEDGEEWFLPIPHLAFAIQERPTRL